MALMDTFYKANKPNKFLSLRNTPSTKGQFSSPLDKARILGGNESAAKHEAECSKTALEIFQKGWKDHEDQEVA